ncbi:FAD-dependent oxidoreductase [Ramlibacter sp. AW1]|uniref:FAD-dependent oxidoreductase n=1 Tax=Ramlibacter aurantiacus TaxID=2801330 RepID=A0A937D1M9_9BURK|nr:FAD-dependent oxidoreductase [Ramlibacter aurantiacus]MBL0420694.1 FAD-dependent oxidoreductase [Ramlibacter aurantiacus]
MTQTRHRILILGAGFAGLWSALGAARQLAEVGRPEVEVLVVNPRDHHSIRVRNYEEDLADTLVPLPQVLNPAGVGWLQGQAHQIDLSRREVEVATPDGLQHVGWDRLVLATGSRLVRPAVPGIEHAFDIDTYDAATRLGVHLAQLGRQPPAEGRWTVVVVGAGLTGIELASELPQRLRRLTGEPVRVVLVDKAPRVGHAMGGAQPVIEGALGALGVEHLTGTSVARIDADAITFADGSRLATRTVVWCGGLRAHPLAEQLSPERDGLGRVYVDEFMRVRGVPGVFAAGDVANARLDGEHESVMSCQHGRPMGRFAGHNAVCDLLGLPMLALRMDGYTTLLDLGPWGAVCTEGWDRRLSAEGDEAKRIKMTVNRERIYPPRSGARDDLLAAAAPVVQGIPLRTRATGS